MNIPNKFALPLVPGVVVCINMELKLLWLVFTFEQYTALDAEHGTFDHPTIQLYGETLVGNARPMVALTGAPALMMIDLCMEVYQTTQGRSVRMQSVSGMSSSRIRENGDCVAGLICGSHEAQPWLAVAYSTADLVELQRRFPSPNWENTQTAQFLGLPAASDEQFVVLTGEVAFVLIVAAVRRGLLR